MELSGRPILLDATLRPNPPMSAPVLCSIILVLLAINAGFGLMFVLRGAWPITPFMGLDVLLLAWAFHESKIASRAFERVTLTPSQLLVLRHAAGGSDDTFALNPYWVRVELAGEPDMPRCLNLNSHGKVVQIGTFLSPGERLNFARALQCALTAARSWRPAE